MGKSGILYMVGTGPGSSELMTLGAVKTLQKFENEKCFFILS